MNEQKFLNIYIESNPNPNSLKFVVDYMLVPAGESFDFPDKESAKHAPLANELFNFPFVKRVFYMSNFVTVTKVDEVDWEDIRNELKEYIKKWLLEDKPLLTKEHIEEQQKQAVSSNEAATSTGGADIEERIKSVLEEYIKPAVEMDGGAIQYHSFNDGNVKVLLQGSCSGCPSSTITLKAGIENLLKSMIPEVKTVEAEGV